MLANPGYTLDIYDGGSGSHGRALHTVTHGGARACRKRGGRGRGSRRGRGGDKQLDERPVEREKLCVEPKHGTRGGSVAASAGGSTQQGSESSRRTRTDRTMVRTIEDVVGTAETQKNMSGPTVR